MRSFLTQETLAGVPPVRQETVVRSPLEGVNGYHYSHTYGTVVGTGVSANVSTSAGLYAQRVKTRMMLGTMTARATAGYWANDITTAALVGANLWTPGTRGLVLWDGTTNDLLSDGGTTQGLLGYRNAVRAFLWLMFTGTRVEQSDASFVYTTGTWFDETAAAEFSGGTAKSSDDPTALATITYTGTDAVLFLTGRQDGETVSSVVANGGIAQVKVDGVTVANQSLSNQFVKSGGPANRARGPIAIPLLNMGSGTHSITVTNTGTSGTRITVDAIAPVLATPPEVMMFRHPYWPPAQYVTLSSAAGVDAFNAALETVVNEFIALNKPVRTVHVENGFDVNTMISTTQARHLNDWGARHYAERTIEALANRPFRTGANNL